MMNEHAERLFELLIETLRDVRIKGYGSVLPGPLDERYHELAGIYASSSEAGRAAIRAAIPDDLALVLLGYSERFATLAARTQNLIALEEAALAHAIEDFRYDPRENVLRLAIIHHVCRRLGRDPDALFSHVASLASATTARHIEQFVARPEELKSLRAMRIREVQTPEGIAYEPLP